MKNLTFLVIYFFYFGCSENSLGPQEEQSQDVRKIYSTVIEERFSASDLILVVSDSTLRMLMSRTAYQNLIGDLEGVTTELLDTYNELNSTRQHILSIPDIDYVFASDYDGSESGRVVLSLSRVAFNNERTVAIMVLGEYYAPLVGCGIMFLLEKQDDIWVITKSTLIWIS